MVPIASTKSKSWPFYSSVCICSSHISHGFHNYISNFLIHCISFRLIKLFPFPVPFSVWQAHIHFQNSIQMLYLLGDILWSIQAVINVFLCIGEWSAVGASDIRHGRCVLNNEFTTFRRIQSLYSIGYIIQKRRQRMYMLFRYLDFYKEAMCYGYLYYS